MIRKRLLLTHNKIKPYIHIADTTADNIIITFGIILPPSSGLVIRSKFSFISPFDFGNTDNRYLGTNSLQDGET